MKGSKGDIDDNNEFLGNVGDDAHLKDQPPTGYSRGSKILVKDPGGSGGAAPHDEGENPKRRRPECFPPAKLAG